MEVTVTSNNQKPTKRNSKVKSPMQETNGEEISQLDDIGDIISDGSIELPETQNEDDDSKKTKICYSGSITRDELIRYFEAVVVGLRQGTIKFAQESQVVALHPGDTVEFQLKAARKAHLEKVVFELSWRNRNAPALHILSD